MTAKFTKLALAGSMLLPGATTLAATSTGVLTATATVLASCSIGAASLAFGVYNPADTASTDVDTTVSVMCTSGLAYMVLRLKQSERHLREMSDSMPQMVFSCFPDGTSDYFNTRWAEFGGAAFSATTQGWRDLIHPDDKDRVQAAWQVSIEAPAKSALGR